MVTNNLILEILPLTLIVTFFYGAKIQRPLKLLNDEYLSVSSSKCYRGFFAMAVVLVHIAQRCTAGAISNFFVITDTFMVAFFFFLSGYGLQKSYIIKQDNYKKNFLLKRIPSVLFPYIIISIIYWLVFSIADGNYVSIQHIIGEAIKGHLFMSFSWYIVVILLFYFVYWLMMIICKKNYPMMIIIGAIWWLIYVITCKKLQYDSWWYLSPHLLIIGMIWATYERQILGIIEKRYIIITAVIWIMFIVLAFYPEIIPFSGIPFIAKNMIYLTAILSILSFLLFTLKIRIGNKLFSFLGEISLEIYLIQELYLMLLPKEVFPYSTEFLWAVSVIAATVGSSVILHVFFKWLMKKWLCFAKFN